MKSEDPRMINLSQVTAPIATHLVEDLLARMPPTILPADSLSLLSEHRVFGGGRERLAGTAWLRPRFGESVSSDRVFVTNGTQSALFLLCASLVPRGGLLLVEALTYQQIRSVAMHLGFEIEAVGMDCQGILPDQFLDLCRSRNPAALYLVPTAQNPTTATMSRGRRLEIAGIARKFGVVLIEDDAQGALCANNPPAMAALAPDVTWYVQGLSKCIALGLRLAFIVGPDCAKVDALRQRFHGMSMCYPSPISSHMAVEWIEDGAAGRALEWIRSVVGERRQIAVEGLAGIEHRISPGSLHVWIPLPSALEAERVAAACRQKMIAVRPSSEFTVSARTTQNGVRLAITNCSAFDLKLGLKGLVSCL